jgi:hypothetical protein
MTPAPVDRPPSPRDADAESLASEAPSNFTLGISVHSSVRPYRPAVRPTNADPVTVGVIPRAPSQPVPYGTPVPQSRRSRMVSQDTRDIAQIFGIALLGPLAVLVLCKHPKGSRRPSEAPRAETPRVIPPTAPSVPITFY